MTTRALRIIFLVAMAAMASTGCLKNRRMPVTAVGNMPKELEKVTHPDYIIEPPDVLQIDLIAAVPKPPYKLKPLDAVSLKATGVLPDAPIQGVYQIDTDGTINLGAAYGAPVPVVGLTVPEAKNAIMEVLKKTAIAPTLEMALAQSRGMQQVRGPHLVRPDGTVWFDIYGGVRVVGLTVPQARKAIEEHLSQFFLDPEVALNVTGYNSKVYYVCFDSGFNGAGTIIRQPVTGNETVLDVISGVGGLSAIADYKRIWIARPGPAGCPPQLLPIDWRAITEFADPSTNYQILPGDRIFVKAAPMPSFGARMDRVLAPIERLFGFILLGIGTYQNIRFINQGGFGFGGFPAPPVIN